MGRGERGGLDRINKIPKFQDYFSEGMRNRRPKAMRARPGWIMPRPKMKKKRPR